MRSVGGLVFGVAAIAAASVQAVSAADLPVKAPAPVAAYNWTGFYAGLNGGGAWISQGSTTTSGAIGGGQIGYNWQDGNIVVGLETDFQATGLQASGILTSGGVTINETDKQSWIGTTRVRAGWAADRWYFYGTGGLAYTRIKEDGTASGGLVGPYSGSNTKTGWTLGGGVETALFARWTAKVEYLYASFGGFINTYTLPGGSITVIYSRTNENIVRAGLNYRF